MLVSFTVTVHVTPAGPRNEIQSKELDPIIPCCSSSSTTIFQTSDACYLNVPSFRSTSVSLPDLNSHDCFVELSRGIDECTLSVGAVTEQLGLVGVEHPVKKAAFSPEPEQIDRECKEILKGDIVLSQTIGSHSASYSESSAFFQVGSDNQEISFNPASNLRPARPLLHKSKSCSPKNKTRRFLDISCFGSPSKSGVEHSNLSNEGKRMSSIQNLSLSFSSLTSSPKRSRFVELDHRKSVQRACSLKLCKKRSFLDMPGISTHHFFKALLTSVFLC